MLADACLVAVSLVALAKALWLATRFVGRRMWRRERWVPSELRGCEVAYAEQIFRSNDAIQIVARVDRAYRARDGQIVLVELKTRSADRVYLSDVIELSAQRVALTATTAEVSSYGYVVVELAGERATRAHRVELLPPAAVGLLAMRHSMLLRGAAVSKLPLSPVTCQGCSHRRRCRAA